MAPIIVLMAPVLAACQTATLHGVPEGSAGGPPASTPMPQAVSRLDAPASFVIFCLRFEDQCRSAPAQSPVIALDKADWLRLEAVNIGVNRSLRPLDDLQHYGRAEYWTLPTDGYGSCHDYALLKRKDLIGAGFSRAALRLAIAITPAGIRHAVLTVATDKGDYVLDNLTDDILPWNRTGYAWVARQDGKGDDGWVSFATERPSAHTVATASASK